MALVHGTISAQVESHLYLEVCMQQELELEALLTLVAHVDDSLQAILGQCDAVDQRKLQRPCLPRIIAELGAAQSEVELHRVGTGSVLGGRLAQELPPGRPREAVLGQGGCGVSRLGRGAEDLESRVSGASEVVSAG